MAFCGPSPYDRGRKAARGSDSRKVDYRVDKEYERLNKNHTEGSVALEAMPIGGKERVERTELDKSIAVRSEGMMFTLSW